MRYETLETIHDLLVANCKKRESELDIRQRMYYNSFDDGGWNKKTSVSDEEFEFLKSNYKAADERLDNARNALKDFLSTDFH